MINALEQILFPYHGTDNSPFIWLRIGQVSKVYASKDDCGTDKDPQRYVGTVEVNWLDRQAPTSQLVPWSYSSFSNPIISKTESSTSQTNVSSETTQASVGSSCGIFFVPSVGDIVICGYRSQVNPIILGFLPQNLYRQLLSPGDKETYNLLSFGPFRTLKSGEYDIRSQQQAEVYLDRAGSIQLIVRQQSVDDTQTPPIDTTQLPTNELARISLGVTYDDETFQTPVVSSYGKNVIYGVTLANGTTVTVDEDGNVGVSTSGNVDLNGTNVTVNNGKNGAARLDDTTVSNNSTDTAWWTWWANIQAQISALPVTPLDGGATLKAGLATLFGTIPTAINGKITSSSGSVKIGD